MKISSCLLGLIGLVWALYCLFQPIVDMNFGWEKISKDVFDQKFKGIELKEYQEEVTKAKRLIDSIHTKSYAPSISIAAMINGKMIWTYAVGFQDLKMKMPVDTTTQYRIGSTSKALTSLGLGKLVQDGKIQLDSSIQYYSSVFRDKPRISIRQLASHQSGIRNYDICMCFPIWEYYRNKQFESITETISEFESDDLLFHPGDDFSYSSFNFTALSLAMEKVSGDYLSYMENWVFDPLGLSRTKPDLKQDYSNNKAIPYEVRGRMYHVSPEVNLSNKWAGGGFLSTPSDLVHAGNVLLDTSFLNKETIGIITTPQRLNNDFINEQNYALGWRHSFSNRYFSGETKVEIIHHGGMAVGSQALLVVYPEYNMVVAISMNKGGIKGSFPMFDYVRPIAEVFITKLRTK